MKKNKILSLVLMLAMLLQMSVMSVAAKDVSSVYEDNAVVMGNVGVDKAGELVTLLLLNGDGSDKSKNAVKYIETSQIDDNGDYKFKFGYDGFTYDENNKINNCTLYMKVGSQDVSETILSAVVERKDLIKVDLTAEFGESGATAKAVVENLFLTDTEKVDVILAAYNSEGNLLKVKKSDKLITKEYEELSTSFKNADGEISKIVAFAWNTETLIPYCQKVEKTTTDNEITALSIQVGSNETEKRFVWYNTQNHYGARVQYALKADYDKDGGFTDTNSTIVSGTTEIPYDNKKSVSCKAQITDLELGKEYIYRVGDDYTFDNNVYTFKTQDNLKNFQTFGIVSDVHFGVGQTTTNESRKAYIDKFNAALQSIVDYKYPSFLLSTGDNISGKVYMENSTMSLAEKLAYPEEEFKDLFAVPLMKSIPFASTNGNHDVLEVNHVNPYSAVSGYHYNLPNEDGVSGYMQDKSSGDFWFRNGDVLVVGINQWAFAYGNSVSCSTAIHRAFIEKAYNENKDAKWRILVNHVPAYTVGYENPETGRNEAGIFQEFFSKQLVDDFDFDAVFSGHQHSYSRSYQILDGKTVDKDKLVGKRDSSGYLTDEITDPQGTVYYVVPPVSYFSDFGGVKAGYADRYRAWGITSGTCNAAINAGKAENASETKKLTAEAAQHESCIVFPSGAMFINVTVDETGEKSKMTIDALSANNNTIVDSYTIYKTK